MAQQTPEEQRVAGWKRDPWQRAAGRYWDGTEWTEHIVSEERVRSIDPPGARHAEPRGPDRPSQVEPTRTTERRPRDGLRGWPRWAPWSLFAVAGVLIIGAAAAGGGGSRSPAATLGPQATSGPGGCQAADALVMRLLEGMRGGAAALRSANAVALDPPVGKFRFVVAAEIDGPGALAVESRIGAWASQSADGTGSLLALDENAQRYSTWAEAAPGRSAEALRVEAVARPEVGAAKACVKAR